MKDGAIRTIQKGYNKNTKTILTAVLFSMMFMTFAGTSDIYAIQNYKPTSEDIIELDVPKTQNPMAGKVLPILQEIAQTDDAQLKDKLELRLYAMTDDMLAAGLVPTIWYEKDPQYWEEVRSQAVSEVDFSQIKQTAYTAISTSDYKIEAYQTFWCHSGLLNCSTTKATKNTDLSYSLATYVKLPPHATYGNLEAHHKITKNKSGGETIDTNNYLNVQVNGEWVKTCNASYNPHLVDAGATKTLNYCPSKYSAPNTEVYASVFGS